jgi:hypothetical protein
MNYDINSEIIYLSSCNWRLNNNLSLVIYSNTSKSSHLPSRPGTKLRDHVNSLLISYVKHLINLGSITTKSCLG